MRLASLAVGVCVWALCSCGASVSNQSTRGTSAARDKSSNRGRAQSLDPPDPLASVTPSKDGWYDATPLLGALRAELRPVLRELSGLSTLEQIPLYDLRLSLDPVAGTFDLGEEVYFTNRETKPLEEIVFRVYANGAGKTEGGHPRAPKARIVQSSCPQVACETREESPSILSIRPSSPLAPGQRLRVSLTLRGVLTRIPASRTDLLASSLDSLLALGKEGTGDYGLLSVGEGIALYANGLAVLARRTAQAWDREEGSPIGDLMPDDVAHVRARVEIPSDVEAATVGSVVGTWTGELAGKPSRVLSVAAPFVRDFTVVAGAGLRSTSSRMSSVVVRSLYRSSDAQAGERVLDTATHALEVFEKRFGMYPYAELEACEAALIGGAGGVEFSGLVTLASLFYHQEQEGSLGELLQGLGVPEPSSLVGPMLEFVTAHEVAHQWWHGLVGSDSRQYPFLDESLAQYSSVLYFEERYGPERARQVAEQNVRMNYHLMRLLGKGDGAVDRPAAAFGSSIAYAGLVYGKGPYFYDRARKLLGDVEFFEAVRRYVKAWQFRLAPPGALVEELARGPKSSELRLLAQRWFQEARGDQDLGRADLGKVLGMMLGGEGGLSEDVLKPLLEWLKQGTTKSTGRIPREPPVVPELPELDSF